MIADAELCFSGSLRSHGNSERRGMEGHRRDALDEKGPEILLAATCSVRSSLIAFV